MSTGVRILNRQHVPLDNPGSGWMDATDIQREGFKAAQEMERRTGVRGDQISVNDMHDRFYQWMDREGGAEATTLNRYRTQQNWFKGFRGRGWGRTGNPPYRRRGGSSSGYSSLPAAYSPRFVPRHLMAELSNLWHLSRVPHQGRYERMLWTSREFHKEHPELSETAIYKDLSASLEGWA